MKRLNLIFNGKGGVGKSFFAVNFVQYLKDKRIAHVAIDSDNENSTLKRFHPDARFVDLADRRGPDGIFNTLEKSNLVVMDCRAASTDLFIDFFAQINLPAVLTALGASLTLVMPVNHEFDSVDQVQRLGTIRSLESVVQGFEERAARLESDIKDSQKRAAELEAKVGAPFEKEERYHQLVNRQSEIEEQLDLTKNQAPSQVDAATDEREEISEKQTEAKSIQQTRRAAVRV